MFRKTYLLLLFGIFLLTWACTDDKVKNIPDVSHIIPELNIIRFDQELFAVDTNHIQADAEKLHRKYPAFFELYFRNIIPIVKQGGLFDEAFYNELGKFIKNKSIRQLQDTIQIVMKDFAPIEKEFASAAQFSKYYFPDKHFPTIYTLLSEYAYQSFIFEDKPEQDGIGVSLDFFLGADYPYQDLNPRNPQFSAYLTRSFNKDHLVKKALDAYIDDLVGMAHGNTMLDIMIHNGKKLYLLDHLMPYAPDTVKLEYTQAQVDWCKNNEFNMWTHFIDEELLYSTNMREIQKLVSPSPHSKGMPIESPGRTANWVGWQIIKTYMNRYPATSMQALIALNDAQKILQLSKYKPPRPK
ncbi:MAG TPA: hypothetical protein ENK52_04150 [Saprospiraceae bacterium]|nr:hypothetical protein [Saprospiraceae bacterium]